ncbi:MULTISPECIES: 5'-nucleotidase, lipoprotein e(P4) family [unclassified Bacillus (in: firmicutes)]|uniref:5'-nucleotidase, lipoprotein e(P4) family n=1 Tax=unclassified Bacillus (in: firmicutes) TaxID=185979 RepID=UPI001BEBD00F|nr:MULTISPECIES: 5'-nucleotidase, lipoprotein e(P4) family [unclassified Bacillus (in: firmicutes)]MBT2618899.1 5'-nucleotidase, lipoprotein e(P4) family [Bacillus sp. ISL-78]MBT2627875.1 5'-nucleotidase, lipoprotein e(P4) family [Bacillus sp. ISL-101]
MKKKKKFLGMGTVLMVFFSLTACSSQSETKAQPAPQKEMNEERYGEESVMAVLWYQNSGEAEALYYQGYSLGKVKLDEVLEKEVSQNPAIVLDLDETVVDNSPWHALVVKTGKGYPYKRDEWVKNASAKALPGAVDFLNYANEKGVEIYYISNRKSNRLDRTIKNLKMIGAPQATKEHVLLSEPNKEGKESRVQRVDQSHDILLFFGDNLSDFPGFKGKSLEERNKIVNEEKDKFGSKFVIFPNPMYGDWEDVLYDFKDKTNQQKVQIRKENLQYFVK